MEILITLLVMLVPIVIIELTTKRNTDEVVKPNVGVIKTKQRKDNV